MGSVPSAVGTQQTPWHGTGCPQSWHTAGTLQSLSRMGPTCHQPEGAAPGQGCGWVGEGGHRHPLLTAGSQQLVQDRQSVQADLEHQVGKEEEDAGRQQSFEDAAGVTCDTRAELSPSTQGHPNRHPAPSGRAGKGAHCAQRFQGSAPRLGSHQGFVHPAQPQGTPRAKAQDLPVSAVPTWHLPGPAGLGPHQGAVSTPIPAGTSPGNPLKGSHSLQTQSALPPAAAVPPSHPALRALCPFSWPGVGWAGCPPQLRAGLGAAPGQQLSLLCFFL